MLGVRMDGEEAFTLTEGKTTESNFCVCEFPLVASFRLPAAASHWEKQPICSGIQSLYVGGGGGGELLRVESPPTGSSNGGGQPALLHCQLVSP